MERKGDDLRISSEARELNNWAKYGPTRHYQALAMSFEPSFETIVIDATADHSATVIFVHVRSL